MMNFRVIRDAVRQLLEMNADGRFRVIGAQKRGKGASNLVDSNRLVEVYYNRGDYPKSGGGVTGPTKHNCTFRIDLTVASPSKGDVDVIEDPDSTAAEVARAIAAMRESDLEADNQFDDLVDAVYQILMDSRNEDLGLEIGTVASRWVSSVEKDESIERGNYTILTGSMVLTCSTAEPVTGYIGIEAGEIIETSIELDTDTPGKAGVITGS